MRVIVCMAPRARPVRVAGWSGQPYQCRRLLRRDAFRFVEAALEAGVTVSEVIDAASRARPVSAPVSGWPVLRGLTLSLGQITLVASHTMRMVICMAPGARPVEAPLSGSGWPTLRSLVLYLGQITLVARDTMRMVVCMAPEAKPVTR